MMVTDAAMPIGSGGGAPVRRIGEDVLDVVQREGAYDSTGEFVGCEERGRQQGEERGEVDQDEPGQRCCEQAGQAVAAVGDTAQPTPAARFRGDGCRLLLWSPGDVSCS